MTKLYSAGLALALVAANAMAAVDPDLLNLVMPDAKFLAGMRVDQTEASPFGQYVLAQVPGDNAGFQMFMAATGFDPRRDLREILIAGNGDTASFDKGLLVLRGTFQPSQILATAKTLGATISAYHGIDVLTSPEQARPFSAAFLDASTAVAGNPDAVNAAIDRHIAGIVFSGALSAQAMDAGATNHVWFATTASLSTLLNEHVAGLNGVSPQNLLKAVSSASGGLRFGSDAVTISLTTATNTDKDAQALAAVMKFLSGMTAQTGGALIEQAGAQVHVTMSLPEQQAEQLLNSQKPKPKNIAAVGR
jgi:hypothetical protein